MDTYKVIDHEEGTDSLGTPFASVTVSDGTLYASHYSFLRGGCLYTGYVTLRNLKTGAVKEVDLTSWASDSSVHLTYLLSLAEKHVGEEKS